MNTPAPRSGNAPQRRSQPRGVKRARRLLDVATELFVTKGIDETTIDEIVAKAGVAKGTFYHHFNSKEAMLLAIRNTVIEDFEAHVVVAMGREQSQDPLARVEAWVTAVYEAYMRLLPRQAIAFASDGFRWTPRGFKRHDHLVELLEAGEKQGLWKVADAARTAIFIEKGLVGIVDDLVLAGQELEGHQKEVIEMARRVLSV